MSRTLALAPLALLACTSDPPPVVSVSEPPSASETASAPTYTSNAKTEYQAAEDLASSGKLVEARSAFAEVVRRFAYSRVARDAELRIAQIDDKLGRPEAVAEYRAWAKAHPSDERAAAIAAQTKTVGDTTCQTDADCVTTTKHDCCECCPSGPYATSRKWLSWQKTQCASTRCEPCANAPCEPVEPAPAAHCAAGKCVL